MIVKNPFEHFYPENLSPQDVQKLFVKEYTEHNALTAYKHTIVEGSRGSGKSMLFKFLEPSSQKIDLGGWDNFLKKGKAFIGIYINCKTGDYRKSEFEELLKIGDIPQIIAEKVIVHEFIMRIVEWTLKSISEQLSDRLKEDEKSFEMIISALDKKGLYGDTASYPRTLNGLKSIATNERKMVRESILNFLLRYGIPNSKLEYSGNLTESSFSEDSFLFIFFTQLRQMLGTEDIPFFLLFDEAGDSMLLPIQQKIINTFIIQRIQSLVCIKVSVCPESYSTDIDLFGRYIQHIHDYDTINLDSLYTNNTRAYYQRIEGISNKRLRQAEFEITDIRKFLPQREFEIEKMKEAEEYTAQEYDNLPEDKKIADRQNYINKYAKARLFQKFLSKSPYWYTGFDNLVHFSAGTIRSFLNPCFVMVERYIEKYPNQDMKAVKYIPYEIQWETIRKFSNDFVDKELLDRIRRRDMASEERRILQYIFNLIEALGGAFNIRLNNISSRYPRIISFSIKETVIEDPDLEAVLKKALQEGFFQKRWYRGKSGYEMLECYILNRKLCPRYALDLSGFQGRIELSQDILKKAVTNKSKFIAWFKSKEKSGETEAMTTLESFGVLEG
jgi:hypothetical protein